MAQLMFDGLGSIGVSLDRQTVQSILEAQGMTSDLVTLGAPPMELDEEDVIQCGKCKKQFNSLAMFMSHKEEHKLGLELSRNYSSINEPLTGDHFSSLEIQSLDSSTPILVQDGSDILSFRIDQNGSFISASNEDLTSLGEPIILTTSQLSDADFITNTTINMDDELSEMSISQPMLPLEPVDAPTPPIDPQVKVLATKAVELKCDFCNKIFTKNFDLQQHVRCHTGEKPFQCVVCGRAFSQKSNVKKHMATHKVWPEGMSHTLPKDPLLLVKHEEAEERVVVDRSYVCQYCSSTFISYYELKTHMKSHSARKVYKCIQKNCSRTFDDLDSFLTHTNTHPDQVQYRCHVCNKQFLSLGDLGIHQYVHNSNSPSGKASKSQKSFRCGQCKSRFVSPEALEHHKATTSHNFSCTHCGKVFACERYLRRHLSTHGDDNAFECLLCGKGFRTEQYLNTHKVIHSNEKPHACDNCSASFNRKDKLARHMLIHLPIKKFKCPFRSYLGCLKEFNRQDKLKVHLLTHSKQKFSCHLCRNSYNRLSGLKNHEKSAHKGSQRKCSKCGFLYKTKVQLSAHSCSNNNNGAKKERDNVPTIEIIVMPMSRTNRESSSSTYQVTFPSSNQVEGEQSTSEQEVPV